MALLSTKQFDRAADVLRTSIQRARRSWPVRFLSRIHHDAYQRVQADQMRLERDRASRPRAPVTRSKPLESSSAPQWKDRQH